MNSNLLLTLYGRVLEDTSLVNGVSEKEVKHAIGIMHGDYKPSKDILNKSLGCLTDFNEVAYRCAYLFKYAPFHTALSYKAMSLSLSESPYELQELIGSLSGPLKLCSLGGGSGADMIGVLAALQARFGFFRTTAKLVDIMSEWELTFWSVLHELRQHNYGPLSESMSENWFEGSFMTCDVQKEMSEELAEVLKTADIVTMVKFVSAAACKKTSNMIEKIFKLMKPGAFIFFLDNAGGGFKEIVSSAASKCRFVPISAPMKHQHFRNENFNVIKYGYRSCYESKIAVQFLMKSYPANSSEINLTENVSCNENFKSPLAPVLHWQQMHSPQFPNFRNGFRPVDNLMNQNEMFRSDLSPNWQGSNFSPMLNRLEAHRPANRNASFEAQSFSLNSSVETSMDRSYSFDSPLYSRVPMPSLKRTPNYDSGYSDESFDSEMSFSSPMHSSSPYFRAPQRQVRFRAPLGRIDNLEFDQNPMDSASPLPQPWSSNRHPFGSLQHSAKNKAPKRRTVLLPGRINNLEFNENLNSALPLPQPWSSDHPYGTLQHSIQNKAPKRLRAVLMSRPKPYEFKRARNRF